MSKFALFSACGIAVLQLTMCAPVVAADGISADRAWHLGQTYYMRYLGGCGGVGTVVQRGEYWLAPVHFGYAGTFHGYIRVDRRTGIASYGWHPTVSAQSLDSWFASVTKRPRAP
jgi:hypothetical protein